MFVVNFFKEGSNGITCVPNNPWLLFILDLLCELYSCTIVHIRDHIMDLFRHFNMLWTPDLSQRSMETIFTAILKGFLID